MLHAGGLNYLATEISLC